TPWYPDIDAAGLVIVDTNVAKVVDSLRRGLGERTYNARAAWVQAVASDFDLRVFDQALPRYSPRLVQQARYHYRSKSNAEAHADPCGSTRCFSCVNAVCPFAN